MHVLIAPDRFSGNLTAAHAAAALATGWAREAAGDDVVTLPMSDGAAGLLDVVAAARGGQLVPVTVAGPLGEDVPGAVLHVPGSAGGTAFVEADQAVGLHLVAPGDRPAAARHGTSAGLGQLLAAALATGAGRVVVGLPGRGAAHDAGAGLLAGLTAALPHDGSPRGADPDAVAPLTAGGLALAALGTTALLPAVQEVLARVDLVLAVADDLPLLGLHGAGAVLGQDAHVGPDLAQELERALGHATDVLQRSGRAPSRAPLPLAGETPHAHGDGHHGTARQPERVSRRSGSGAGGGAGFMLQLLGGRALAGADVVAAEVGLAEHVARADLVVTGGRVLDGRALTDSVVATVSRQAMGRALPVVVVAEEVQTSRREVAHNGISATYEVRERRRDGSLARAGDDVRELLAARAARLARTWSP